MELATIVTVYGITCFSLGFIGGYAVRHWRESTRAQDTI